MKQDEKILAALLSCGSVRQAAETSGISEGRIFARLRDREFADRFQSCRRELLDDVTRELQTKLNVATSTMVEVAEDPENTPQTRLNAAEMILRSFLRLQSQTEILSRLEELERAVQDG